MQSGVFYYAREGYYRHLHNAALERLKQFGSDPVLLFWKAYAIIMEGIYSVLAAIGVSLRHHIPWHCVVIPEVFSMLGVCSGPL